MLLDLYPQTWSGDGAQAPSVIVTITIPLDCALGSTFVFSQHTADTTQTFGLDTADTTQTFALDAIGEL